MSVRELMRENIQRLEPYRCARDEAGAELSVYLDANENYESLTDFKGVNRYPDSSSLALRKAYGKIIGLGEEQLAVGSGSDELIDLMIRIFCTPGKDSILVLPPTYGEYAVLANINDVKVITCPLNRDYSLNEEAVEKVIREQKPKLTFFCSPNNPTGNLLDREAIKRLARVNENITVVDQAYIDFAEDGLFTVKDVEENERLVILRTLSKAWALAGCRVGFIIASKEILQAVYDVKYPYNISLPSAREALKALENKAAYEERRKEIFENRSFLISELEKMKGVREVKPTDANFFLIRVDEPDLVYEKLKEKGIAVRNRSRELYCEGCLRITVGSKKECETFLKALAEILEEER